MRDSGIVGIGCYAKPETLSRVLKKWVEHYVLGSIEGLVRDNGEKFDPSEGIQLLKTIIGGPAAKQHVPGPDTTGNRQNTRVIGFFLALKRQGLNLSIFTREGHFAGKKYTTNLTCLTKIRQKRLH